MRVFRRIMLDSGIDLESLPDTQKLYYKATSKVSPSNASLGAGIISNKWDSITGEGVIVCSSDITTINDGAFSYKSELTSITIPNSVTSIGIDTFNNCTGLTSITIPESVTNIEHSAFYYCTELTSINIPNGVNKIDYALFFTCTSLTSVTIPNSVTFISDIAFARCTSLKNVTIPNSVTLIRGGAFNGCTSMQYYDFSTHELVPTIINTNVFNDIPSNCKIIVPDALYDDWIVAENWSTYADNIVKASEYTETT